MLENPMFANPSSVQEEEENFISQGNFTVKTDKLVALPYSLKTALKTTSRQINVKMITKLENGLYQHVTPWYT